MTQVCQLENRGPAYGRVQTPGAWYAESGQITAHDDVQLSIVEASDLVRRSGRPLPSPPVQTPKQELQSTYQYGRVQPHIDRFSQTRIDEHGQSKKLRASPHPDVNPTPQSTALSSRRKCRSPNLNLQSVDGRKVSSKA